MFQEKDFPCEGFDSTWKHDIVTQEDGSQTTEFSVKEQETSTKTCSCAQVQTNITTILDTAENTDMDKLAQWLNSIYPLVKQELEDDSLSIALKSAQMLEDSVYIPSNLIQVINPDNKDEKLFISDLSWNCTGNTIAITYSFIHDSWCSHEGFIHLFTLDRNDQFSKCPNKKLVFGACITSAHFHPTEPSILCTGTITGEILFWNCHNATGDDLISSFVGHDDKVTLVRWIPNTTTKKQSIVLITTSLDSTMLLWEFDVQDSVAKIQQKYKVNRSVQISQIDDIYSKRTEKGIVHVDFSPHIAGLFVLGMEAGLVVKCSVLGARTLTIDSSGMNTFDPFISSYAQHAGEITSIQFSPHRKDLFLTCATDDEIRIYHIEQVTPVQKIFVDSNMHCVSWIPYEKNLLVACGEHGIIKIFSLLNGQVLPCVNTLDNELLTTLAINRKRVNMVAFGNIKGSMQLWYIPWNNIAKEHANNIFHK